MIRRSLIALLAVLALVVTGCGDDAEDGTAVGAGSGADRPVGLDVDGDDVVLLVENVDGFLTREATFQMLPQTVVYGDGTVIEPGAQILIYPGPALPAVNRSAVDAATVEAIVAAAREAGLDTHEADYGRPLIEDAGDTVVTVEIDGEVYVHRATALALDPEGTPSEGVDADQAAARQRLATFLDEARQLVADGTSEDPVPYAADRFRLYVQSAVGVPADPEIDPSERDWGIDGVELAASDCTPVEPPAAEELADVLADADALTRFSSGGEEWIVIARPVLPHETTCPA